MKKLLITCTDLMMIQFLVPHVKHLSENGYQVDIACSVVAGGQRHVDNLVASATGKTVDALCQCIENQEHDMICINDPDEATEILALAEKLRGAFEKILPEKSRFEK